MGPDAGVIQAIFDQMKHAYIGETPFDTERVVAKIMSAGWYSFERTARLVIGGLDMACWDALGKFLKPPITSSWAGLSELSSVPCISCRRTRISRS